MRCYQVGLALIALMLGSTAVLLVVSAETYAHRIYDRSSPQPSDTDTDIASRSFFFVCGSEIDGLDGKYVLLEDSSRTWSDVDAPVFVREDDEDDDGSSETDDSAMVVTRAQQQQREQKDMRLFRHNGFWMFADVGVWPPATHFRCDPNKREALRLPQELNMLAVCHVNLQTPPRMGFSPAKVSHGIAHLMLQTRACSTKEDEGQERQEQHERAAASPDNLTKLAASVSSLASRFSEL
ncbi:hypothetical protein Gpo141_00014276 [Globisporangium polare]